MTVSFPRNLTPAARRTVEVLLLFVLLAVAILYCVRPWRAYFFTGLADHWDPRLMGQWMAWNAHNILHGHILRPDYHANFFYPHAYTLAFSELLWPESFVYAAVYAFSKNLFLSFNATMLFFWALSGLAMYALLRELGVCRAVSYLGAFIFCLIPYRMRYYVEFNMVLVFVIPLLLLLWIRWLRHPSIRNALWFVAGFWLAATSCLYFTFMTVIMLAFVFAAFVTSQRGLLFKRKFWLSLGTIFGGVAAVSGIYLYPYALLRIHGGYARTTVDYLKHHAQAMHYLDTHCAALIYPLFTTPRTRTAETYLFLGTVLGILALIFLVTRLLRFVSQTRSNRLSENLLVGSKFILWVVFWTTIGVHAFYGRVAWLALFDRWLYAVSFALIVLYGIGVFWVRSSDRNELIRSGLAAAAVFCFFVSLGPLITTGPDAVRLNIARGPFADIAAWVPLFGAVRGLTRFAIVILIYLLVAGCITLSRFVRKDRRLIWLFPVLIGLLVFEASMMKYRYTNYSYVVKSKIVRKIQQLPRKSVIFQLPAAVRTVDATIVMDTIGNFPLLINGYSGFTPSDYQKLFYWEKTGWQLDKITKWLSQIWPPVYLVIDKQAKYWLSTGWHKPFPQEKLQKDWQLIDQDMLYALYGLRPRKIIAPSLIRRIRSDVLEKHPVLCFSARLTKIAYHRTVSRILLDNREVDREIITTKWCTYRVPLPSKNMGRLAGDEVKLELMKPLGRVTAEPAWEVRGVYFAASR